MTLRDGTFGKCSRCRAPIEAPEIAELSEIRFGHKLCTGCFAAAKKGPVLGSEPEWPKASRPEIARSEDEHAQRLLEAHAAEVKRQIARREAAKPYNVALAGLEARGIPHDLAVWTLGQPDIDIERLAREMA